MSKHVAKIYNSSLSLRENLTRWSCFWDKHRTALCACLPVSLRLPVSPSLSEFRPWWETTTHEHKGALYSGGKMWLADGARRPQRSLAGKRFLVLTPHEHAFWESPELWRLWWHACVDYFGSCLGGVGVHPFLSLSLSLWKGALLLSCLSSSYVEEDKVESTVRMCVFTFVYENVYSSFSQSEWFHMARYGFNIPWNAVKHIEYWISLKRLK